MKIATDELIAKEACYHKRCYSAYTIFLYNDERECQPKTEHISDIAFNAIKEKLLDLHKNQTITEFSNFTQAVEQYLVSKEFDKVEINSAKWNLRRKIESKSRDFKFLNIHRILLIYPESITVEDVIETYYEMKTELDTLKQISKEEKTVFQAGQLLRTEIKNMTDTMHWPPRRCDLSVDKINLGNEVLKRALMLKDHLKLSSIVCVFDQSIFAKAMEIKWKNSEKYKDCIIMLGTFHTIMMFMAIIYKRFKDAGLKDVMIQSGVLAEGSVDQALSGKMYNRGIRAYKLMYEALLSIFLENMEEYYENDLWNISFIQDGKAALEELAKDPCDETYQQFSNSKDFKSYYHLFLDYQTKMRSDGSQLTQFWITFLDMVEVLLNTVYATRAGRWVLLLESYRDIIPYTFAYDHLNYAKYLTPLLAELVNLDQSHIQMSIKNS